MNTHQFECKIKKSHIEYGLVYLGKNGQYFPRPGKQIFVYDDEDRVYDLKMHSKDPRIDGLTEWYQNHANVNVGDTVFITIISESKVRLSPKAEQTQDLYFPNEKNNKQFIEVFLEGDEKLELHIKKERNKSLVNYAKKIWNNKYEQNVPCIVCSFSFYEKYGDIGSGFIEAHHIVPLVDLTKDTEVKVSDLVPVCANCHRMLHRRRPWLSIDELKHLIKK